MYTLMVNVQMSRRGQLAFVLDADDQVQWSGKSMAGGLQYLWDKGETEFRLEGPNPDDRFILTMRRA